MRIPQETIDSEMRIARATSELLAAATECLPGLTFGETLQVFHRLETNIVNLIVKAERAEATGAEAERAEATGAD